MELSYYQDRFEHAAISRDEAGVLVIRFHTGGDTFEWNGPPHTELPDLFAMVAADRDNRVVVITGTGDTFIAMPDPGPEMLASGIVGARYWDQIISEGNRLVGNLLAIEVPVIAAVNGPVSIHSELAVLADVVVCSERAWFQDAAHFGKGLVPGDSMQIVWPLLLGPNRGRSFLLLGDRIDAAEALRLGVIAESRPPDEVLDRALEIAAQLATQNPLLLRNSRAVLVRPLRKAVADDLHLGLALEALAAVSGAEPE